MTNRADTETEIIDLPLEAPPMRRPRTPTRRTIRIPNITMAELVEQPPLASGSLTSMPAQCDDDVTKQIDLTELVDRERQIANARRFDRLAREYEARYVMTVS
ncbi:MAG TPA: hypothetical protein VGL61_31745 [Kofleriaceae bacterium]|jgi:hypothetical protein